MPTVIHGASLTAATGGCNAWAEVHFPLTQHHRQQTREAEPRHERRGWLARIERMHAPAFAHHACGAAPCMWAVRAHSVDESSNHERKCS